MEDMLNIGIIGAGRIGKVHAETLTYRIPEPALLAIADIDLPAAQQVAAQFGSQRSPTTTGDPGRTTTSRPS